MASSKDRHARIIIMRPETEQTFLGTDDQQFLMSTTTEYAPDGRILEQRTKNTDGSEWATCYTYHADGRLLKTVTGNAGSGDRSETAYLYDEARRLVAVKSGDKTRPKRAVPYNLLDRCRDSAA